MKEASNTYNISYDNRLKAVIMKWEGYANSDQFREGTELMLNTLIQNRCSKVLASIQDMAIIGMDDQKWLDSTFLPRAIRFGFKEIAIVKPKSYFNQVAVVSVSQKINKEDLNTVFFDTEDEASKWLVQAGN
ncbi:MAG: hypothetical protein ACXVPN_16785 [Bacteroidia bacterium]